MLMLLIRLFAILMLSTFELITFFWNQGVYTPTLKKHQVVRDLKKFENHWSRVTVGHVTWLSCPGQQHQMERKQNLEKLHCNNSHSNI